MWMLPPLKLDGLNPPSFQARPVYQSMFPFTHHRVTLCVYRRSAPKRIAPGQQWFRSLEEVAMPSPHRRAAQSLIQTLVEP
jgi:hypothetical protein